MQLRMLKLVSSFQLHVIVTKLFKLLIFVEDAFCLKFDLALCLVSTVEECV